LGAEKGAAGAAGGASPYTLEYVSPSAIETFDQRLGGCARKWAFVKLDRVPKVQNDAARIGDAMHKHHERYLLAGVPYDQTQYEGRLAAATMHLLPRPAPGAYEVEKDVRIKIAGYWFGGRIDLRWKETSPHPEYKATAISVVLDHKSIGDLRWAKLTKPSLLEHPQAPIYALATMADHGTEVAELRWNYAQKNSPNSNSTPKAVPSWHTVTCDEAYAGVSPWLETAAHMHEVVRLANTHRLRAINLPPNPEACDSYGGCPFRSRCTDVTRKVYLDYMTTGEKKQGFMDRLKARTAATGVSIPPPTGAPVHAAPPPAAPVAAPPPAVVPLAAAPAPAPAPVPPPVAPPAPAPLPAPAAVAANPPVAPAVQQAPAPQHYGNAINPPESALPVAAPPALAPAPVTPPAAVEAPPVEVVTEAPKRPRGRPRKNPAPGADVTTVVNNAPPAESFPADEYEAIRAASIIASGAIATIASHCNLPEDVAKLAVDTYAAIVAEVRGPEARA
jgi:hypothetical protein